MADNSKIQWTDHTWNPWIGCTKVSAGCDNCYAENLMDRRYGRVQWGAGNPRSRTKTWGDPVRWNKQVKKAESRPRVFCASLSDIFDPEVSTDLRREALNVIDSCKNLDWLLLTKRPQLIKKLLIEAWGEYESFLLRNPNVILGTTIENQKVLSHRSEALWDIASEFWARTFYSVEPLLEDVNLHLDLCPVDWVIVGGESGANARPFNIDWVRNIYRQCDLLGVSFFFKQTGSNCFDGDRPVKVSGKGGEWDAIPEDLRIREFYRPLQLQEPSQ